MGLRRTRRLPVYGSSRAGVGRSRRTRGTGSDGRSVTGPTTATGERWATDPMTATVAPPTDVPTEPGASARRPHRTVWPGAPAPGA